MIELISLERCVGCKMCAKVCPTNVFEMQGKIPVIARQEDCQTCFMCEAYCPVDALYVAPQGDELIGVQEEALIQSGLLGSWRAEIGWGPRAEGSMAERDTTPYFEVFTEQYRISNR